MPKSPRFTPRVVCDFISTKTLRTYDSSEMFAFPFDNARELFAEGLFL